MSSATYPRPWTRWHSAIIVLRPIIGDSYREQGPTAPALAILTSPGSPRTSRAGPLLPLPYGTLTDEDSSVDHLTPRVRDGTNRRDNLGLACRRCNGHKSIMTAEKLVEWCSRVVEVAREVG